jgi:hypothetical protein
LDGIKECELDFSLPSLLENDRTAIGDGIIGAALQPSIYKEAAPNKVLSRQDERNAPRCHEPRDRIVARVTVPESQDSGLPEDGKTTPKKRKGNQGPVFRNEK